jgi:hypothetical protein
MPNTFELIASSTVGAGGTSAIEFTSIPSTYTDLCVKVSSRSDRAGTTDNLFMKINGVTTNRSARVLYGNGSSASSFTETVYIGELDASGSTASTFSSHEIYIPNYAGTTWNKAFSVDAVTEQNGTAAYATLLAGLWSQTSAITSLSFYSGYGTTLVQYSTAYLYGVKNA